MKELPNIPSRKLFWISSIDKKNQSLLNQLEEKLSHFYNNNADYYSDIDFTKEYWTQNIFYKDIAAEASQAGKICEIGCGRANILHNFKDLSEKYSGSDFSSNILQENIKQFPGARFTKIENVHEFPFEDEQFDLVFSIFVLEHVVRPHLFLRECNRILKKNGKLIILCPDYLKFGRLVSQRAGLTAGNTIDKLRQNKWIDAVITLFDNKVKIPAICRYYSAKNLFKTGFYINLNPVVFYDSFYPDVDAVYLTDKSEIIKFLSEKMDLIKNGVKMISAEKEKRWIYLKMIKK